MIETCNHIVADDLDVHSERLQRLYDAFDMTRSATCLRSRPRRGTKIHDSRIRSIQDCDGCAFRPQSLLLEPLQFPTRLSDVARARQRFATNSAGRSEKEIRSRSSQHTAVRIDHEHFARTRKCSKDHEEILTSLPRESFSAYREDVGTETAQGFET